VRLQCGGCLQRNSYRLVVVEVVVGVSGIRRPVTYYSLRRHSDDGGGRKGGDG